MQYCPYCSTPVSSGAKSCHNCKHSLDFNTIADALENNDESSFNKKALRKIWLKERMRFIWPVCTLIVGFIIGGIILYGFASVRFSVQTNALEGRIDSLNTQIASLKATAQNAASSMDDKLKAKDNIINLLNGQRQSLSGIINFTRRFSSNSIITPNNEAETESFRRNFFYLQRQFEDNQDELNKTTFENDNLYNLKTIPQFLEE